MRENINENSETRRANLGVEMNADLRAETKAEAEVEVDGPAIIRPGEPGYMEYAPEVDALGGKPMSLAAGLRFAESELHKMRKLKAQGYENTIPELADGSSEEIPSRPIDERIAELEKMVVDFEKAIAWAEAKRPGSSKNENGALLMEEYEREAGEKA